MYLAIMAPGYENQSIPLHWEHPEAWGRPDGYLDKSIAFNEYFLTVQLTYMHVIVDG